MNTIMQRGARFSACGAYRYILKRQWVPGGAYVAFIGLNPSTADSRNDDPTIRRCIAFAKLWGYGGLRMLNLFAFKATDPREMKRAANPVGMENDAWLGDYIDRAATTVAAWGNHGSHLGRSAIIRGRFPDLRCLGVTRSGEPRHPLYLRADSKPMTFNQL